MPVLRVWQVFDMITMQMAASPPPPASHLMALGAASATPLESKRHARSSVWRRVQAATEKWRALLKKEDTVVDDMCGRDHPPSSRSVHGRFELLTRTHQRRLLQEVLIPAAVEPRHNGVSVAGAVAAQAAPGAARL